MSDPSELSGGASRSATLLEKLTATRLPLWVSLALLVLWLVTFGWQSLAQKRLTAQLEKDRAAMTAQFETDRQALLGRLRSRFDTETDESRRQFGLALAWAVRSEMIRNNLDQVDQFFTEIVRLPNTERAVLAGTDGKILVSTDRRHVGADAAALVGAEALQQGQVSVRAAQDGARDLVIPVMGLNSRLGTVIVTSRPADAFASL
ncbi:MAG: hypothetical protein ACLGG4_04905 [Gammaproteobacteria bacterium]